MPNNSTDAKKKREGRKENKPRELRECWKLLLMEMWEKSNLCSLRYESLCGVCYGTVY